MFEDLKKYPKIIVTGAQRSGTRICTKMIAYDTGYRFIDETEVTCFDKDKIRDIIKYDTNWVLQCPCIAHTLTEFAKDCFIVFMRRNSGDVEASVKRIFNKIDFRAPKRNFGDPDTCCSIEKKYEHLERQRKDIPNLLEIEYENLSAHPLWVEKEKRVNFRWNQTYENQYNDTNIWQKVCNV